MDRKTVSNRRSFLFFTTTGAASLFVASLSSLSANAAMQTAQAGKVVSVEGRVLIRQDGPNAGLVALKPGAQVREGDVINTASDGKVKLLLEDKTILDLGGSALFKVEKFEARSGGDRQVSLDMAYGTVRASVSQPVTAKGKFQIRTRTATMGVRGTEFIVQAPMGQSPLGAAAPAGQAEKPVETKVTVVQGKVEVKPEAPAKAEGLKGDSRRVASAAKPQAPVLLTAGTQLTTNASAPTSKPITLTSTELSAVTTAGKVQDNTFQKAVTLDLHSDGAKEGSSGGESGGSATRAALAHAIAVPIVTTSMGNTGGGGFIGGFSPSNVMNPSPAIVPVGGLKHIHIVVTQ